MLLYWYHMHMVVRWMMMAHRDKPKYCKQTIVRTFKHNLSDVNKQLYKLSNTIYQLVVSWSVTLVQREIKSQHSSHFSAGSYDAFTTLMVVIIFQLVEQTASQSFSKQHSMNPHFLDQCSWVGGLIIWRKNVQARNKHNISMILVSNHWKLSR